MRLAGVEFFSIGPRLMFLFAVLIALILGGNSLLVWQFHIASLQTRRLAGANQQVVAVLRLQGTLLSFHLRLDDLERSRNADALATEAEPLRSTLVEIFLDEVGELPMETQIALLRVLQEHEFERVGGTRSIPTNVRVVAATNRNLQAAISAGTFRSDLFYRLNVFPSELPSLRERRADIPVLVEYFIDRSARNVGKNIREINKESLDLLQSYPWPGNIRELQNVIERSVILCETENLSVDETWLPQQTVVRESKSQSNYCQKLASREKEMIESALRESEGRVFGPSGAAAILGMPRSTVESKIRSLRINKNRFKSCAGMPSGRSWFESVSMTPLGANGAA